VQTGRDDFSCGVIEGFYGRPWSFEARADHADFSKQNGFGFYLYAPKGDVHLRKAWRQPWPREERRALEALRARYRECGVAFGIGFTPWGAQTEFGPAARSDLRRKLAEIDALEPDLLAILFDDMPGVVGNLAERQIAVTHDASAATRARSLLFCPTYYSDDPVLESALGPMPARYLEDLGKGLDAQIRIFWTGPRICSREYTGDHLAEVAARLGRKPFLWDNYPVNDGPRMCRYLHLRAAAGRPAALREWTSGLAANPMNQPQLSKIPLLTLRESLAKASGYDAAAAFRRAARAVCEPALAEALEADLPALHDEGLGTLDAPRRAALRARYASFEEPCAREVVQWLDGVYEPDAEILAAFEGWDI
jgi:hyaluronoglucosaminidase